MCYLICQGWADHWERKQPRAFYSLLASWLSVRRRHVKVCELVNVLYLSVTAPWKTERETGGEGWCDKSLQKIFSNHHLSVGLRAINWNWTSVLRWTCVAHVHSDEFGKINTARSHDFLWCNQPVKRFLMFFSKERGCFCVIGSVTLYWSVMIHEGIFLWYGLQQKGKYWDYWAAKPQQRGIFYK